MNPLEDFKPEIKLFLIVAAAAVIIAVGGILLLRGMTLAPSLTPIVQQTPPPTPSPQPQTLDTSNWQTYRNEEFGFEVKYPREWNLNSSSGRFDIMITSAERDVYIYRTNVPPQGNAWIAFFPSQGPNFPNVGTFETETSYGDDMVVSKLEVFSEDGRVEVVGVTKNYWEGDPLANEYEQIFDQILSTFRLVE